MSSPVQRTEYNPCGNKHNIVLYTLLILLLLICYHNSFQASWHFDDIANIVLNAPLHIDNLSTTSLKQTFFAYPDQPDKLFRPVSNLTFGINWYVGGERVFGYHLVNFIIHVLTALFLYHTCLLLLNSPGFSNRYRKNKFIIAGLATLLWAVNPVQTQAITYIVQRMALLATLFSIIGIWCYLKARCLQPVSKKSLFYYLGTCVSFLLAIGSKENAVVFPASLVLIELFFFQQTIRFNKQNIFLLITGLALILIFTLLLVGPDFFPGLVNSYESRDFTLWQRVLTEARIVIFYISLLLYPSPLRLSITHDVEISTSLFSPVTTLPAVLSLVLLTTLAFVYHKRYPLLSFAILFFLLNHIVESTVIPLELLFEHRNYLPSLFLFLPLAAGICIMLERYKKKSRMVYVSIISGVILFIVLLSLGTINRNNVWLTERSLWTDSLTKAPESARSYINLAHGYLFQDKNYKKAFELNYLSLDKQSPTPWKDRLRAYNSMAIIMTRVGNYEQALLFYDKALNFAKKDSTLKSEVLFQRVKTQWLYGQTDPALNGMAKLIDTWPNKGNFLQLYGEMLVTAGRTTEGLVILKKALANSSVQSLEYKLTLLDLSLVYGKLDSPQKSNFFLAFARKLDAPLIPSALCQLENSLRAEQTASADHAWEILLSQLSWPSLIAILEETYPERPTLPLNYSLLQQYATDWLAARKTQ